MIKIILALITAVSLAVSPIYAATGSQIVQVVWPFASGSAQAAKVRHLIDAANQQQTQYHFVFSHRPGAGGVVATKSTAAAPGLTVLATTDSFYTRPLMYHDSYDIDQFRLISTVCLQSPLTLLSRKYSSAAQVRNQTVTVSIIPGSITQLFTQILSQRNADLKFTEIPYSGTVEGIRDLLGGHIDFSVDLGTDITKLSPGVSVVGITGTRNLPGASTFASQGIRGVEKLTIGYYIFVPATVDLNTARQLNQIFNSAAVSGAVRASCANQSGVTELTEFDQLEQVNRANQARWKSFTSHIQKQ
jgi:tripartite-type tricarboxylate transporter receptor subunit TctC